MRARYLVVAGVLSVLVVHGCTSWEGERPGGEGGSRVEGLTASLQVRVQSDSVRLVLHVTNETSRPVAFTFPTSQRYEFTVETMEGERVWTWSDGRAFMQAIVEAALPAGDTWTFEESWRPGGRAGVYVATGMLVAPEVRVSQRATFELP